MDKKKSPADEERGERKEKFQSETGRGIDSFVSTSPLFYTVSGPYSQTHRQGEIPRYYEQLGCPSILKPSFRDLPGCTRLSVGVPSTPYRQYPLDKLNNTIMGKSPTTQGNSNGKRYTRGEKYLAPIKVNAKIRHIYSHITSSSQSQWSQSQESSQASTSTQTELDDIQEPEYTNIEDLCTDEQSIVNKKDASTCMSPPPSLLPQSPITSEPYYYSSAATVSSSAADRLFSIPPSYAGKLEDLEKITGHIVIQRFFTRADEAFGCWLEKQLGMNSKSVGVDTAESSEDGQAGISRRRRSASARRSEVIDELSPVDEATSESEEAFVIVECSVDDLVQCECFKDHFETEDKVSSTGIIEPTMKDLSLIEQDLVNQCIEFEIQESYIDRDLSLEKNNQIESEITKVVQSDIDKTEIKRFSGSIDHAVTEELIRNMDQLIKEVSANEMNNFEETENDEDEMKQDGIDASASEIKYVTEEPAPQSLETLPRQNAEDEESEEEKSERPCVPDIINISDIYASDAGDTEIEIDQSTGTINLNQSSMESQCKVVEYLGKLDRSIMGEEIEEELETEAAGATYSNEFLGESSGERLLPIQDVEGLLLKRSLSIDSCIGTESSGEARHNLNDSGINLDSGRVDEVGEGTPSVSDKGPSEGSPSKEVEENLENKASLDGQDSQEQEVTIVSNKSLDESNSRSDLSSAIKIVSDGEDADQSESDSEVSSLRRPAGSNMAAVIEEFEKEDEDAFLLDADDNVQFEDEPDQFDVIIESHEKEKRIRPVCRKRNVSTQTTRSVESSIVTTTTTSRSTTATSTSADSSFDLEFVSKSKKYVSHLSSASNNSVVGGTVGDKKRSYLPSGSSSLNVLNMKFTMGREFESEVSIRIPPKSPATTTTTPGSSQTFKPSGGSAIPQQNQASASTARVVDSSKGRSSQQSKVLQDSDLKNLWRDVKSRMESRVGESRLSLQPTQNQNDLSVRGNRMKLISIDSEYGAGGSDINILDSQKNSARFGSEVEDGSRFLPDEEERIKRSLKRLKKILDD